MGPVPLETATIRSNHNPAVWAIIAKEGPSFDPAFRVIALGTAIGKTIRFSEHPDRAAWEAPGNPAAVYFLECPGASLEQIEIIRAEIKAALPTDGRI